MIDKEILNQLYFVEKFTTRKIAEKLNATPMQVFYAMKKYGMELRTNRPKNPLTVEEVTKLYASGMSQSQIADHFGIARHRVVHFFVKNKLEAREFTTKGMKFPGRIVSDEVKKKLSIWHTGRPLSSEHREKVTKNLIKAAKERTKPVGYTTRQERGYFVRKGENGKREYVHRIIASETLGRPLVKGEEVHHIDINPSNNNPDNLIVLQRKDHLKLHSQFEYLIGELYSKGLISFNRDKKEYFII